MEKHALNIIWMGEWVQIIGSYNCCVSRVVVETNIELSRPVHASLNSSLFHCCISHATICTCCDIRNDEMQPVYTDNFLVPLPHTAISHFNVERIFLSKCSVRLQFTRNIISHRVPFTYSIYNVTELLP